MKMKISSDSYKMTISEMDQDTGLTVEELRQELKKGANSPTVEFSKESIVAKGRARLDRLYGNR